MRATYGLSQSTVSVGEVSQISLVVRFGADHAKDKADAPPRRPLNLSLVLDRSGSMGGSPLRQALKSAKALVGELTEKDLLSVVTFDDNIDTLVAPALVADKRAIQAAIDKVHAGGCTNLCGGWEAGGKHAVSYTHLDVYKRQTGIELNRLLRSIQLLLNTQESVLARTLDATAKAFDESKKPAYAAAVLDEKSTLYDDLAPILVRLLRDPDLLRDVLLLSLIHI